MPGRKKFVPPVLPQFECKRVLRGHTKAVASVKFSPDGNLLASASADGTVRLWAALEGCHKTTLEGHRQGISDCAWGADSLGVYSASDDRTVKVWDVTQGHCTTTLHGHTNFVFSVDGHPADPMVASGSFDQTARLWDVRAGQCVSVLARHTESVSAVSFSPDGIHLATAASDGCCYVWDLRTHRTVQTVVRVARASVQFCKYAPDDTGQLLVSLDTGMLLLLDRRGRRVCAPYRGHTSRSYCVFAAFTSCPTLPPLVVCGSEDQALHLWHRPSATPMGVLHGHSDVVLCCACHPTLALFASGALENDSSVRLWAPIEPP